MGELPPTDARALTGSSAVQLLPVPVAGRNRLWRKLAIDAIVSDPTASPVARYSDTTACRTFFARAPMSLTVSI